MYTLLSSLDLDETWSLDASGLGFTTGTGSQQVTNQWKKTSWHNPQRCCVALSPSHALGLSEPSLEFNMKFTHIHTHPAPIPSTSLSIVESTLEDSDSEGVWQKGQLLQNTSKVQSFTAIKKWYSVQSFKELNNSEQLCREGWTGGGDSESDKQTLGLPISCMLMMELTFPRYNTSVTSISNWRVHGKSIQILVIQADH